MEENKVILITALFNLIVAILKLISGIFFSFSTLIADSIQSFIDFLTDITSLIANKIGSLGMSIYVFYTSINMMICNIRGMLTNDEENNEIKEEIEKELEKFKDLQFKKVKVIKMSTYYSVFLQVKVNENITIKDYIAVEKKLKAHLKSVNKQIRFIDIEPL